MNKASFEYSKTMTKKLGLSFLDMLTYLVVVTYLDLGLETKKKYQPKYIETNTKMGKMGSVGLPYTPLLSV